MGDLHRAAKAYIDALNAWVLAGPARDDMTDEAAREAYRAQATVPMALAALRAAAAQDTGWHDLPPTVEEAREHAARCLPGVAEWQIATASGRHAIVSPDATYASHYCPTIRWIVETHGATRWRPLTAEGDPAAWPEVTT